LEKYEFIEAPLAEQNETLLDETGVNAKGVVTKSTNGEDSDSTEHLLKNKFQIYQTDIIITR